MSSYCRLRLKVGAAAKTIESQLKVYIAYAGGEQFFSICWFCLKNYFWDKNLESVFLCSSFKSFKRCPSTCIAVENGNPELNEFGLLCFLMQSAIAKPRLSSFKKSKTQTHIRKYSIYKQTISHRKSSEKSKKHKNKKMEINSNQTSSHS